MRKCYYYNYQHPIALTLSWIQWWGDTSILWIATDVAKPNSSSVRNPMENVCTHEPHSHLDGIPTIHYTLHNKSSNGLQQEGTELNMLSFWYEKWRTIYEQNKSYNNINMKSLHDWKNSRRYMGIMIQYERKIWKNLTSVTFSVHKKLTFVHLYISRITIF